MFNSKIIGWIITGGLVSLGIVFCLISLGIYISSGKKVQECTAQTTGIVIRTEAKTTRVNRHSVPTTSYYPVYEYYAGGKNITKESNIGYGKVLFKEGEKITVYYDPNHVEKHYVVEMKTTLLTNIFMAVGFSLIVVGMIALIIWKKVTS